jgi:hypothetical protein
MELKLKSGRVHIDGEDHALSVIDLGRAVGASMEPKPEGPTVVFFVSPADGAHKLLVELTTTEAVKFAAALLDTVGLSEDHWRGKFGAF